MRLLPLIALMCASLGLSVAHAEAPATPRSAPDFTIRFPGGQMQALASYRGKVIALEFLYTTCPHCQHASQIFSKLAQEYGARGFQPLGVAFNDMSNMLVPDFVKTYNVTYPIGYAPREDVLSFLGVSAIERFVVPQIVWIDRKGMIRSQTPPLGDEKLLQESYWREMIETLLKEPAAAVNKSAAPHRTVAHKRPS